MSSVHHTTKCKASTCYSQGKDLTNGSSRNLHSHGQSRLFLPRLAMGWPKEILEISRCHRYSRRFRPSSDPLHHNPIFSRRARNHRQSSTERTNSNRRNGICIFPRWWMVHLTLLSPLLLSSRGRGFGFSIWGEESTDDYWYYDHQYHIWRIDLCIWSFVSPQPRIATSFLQLLECTWLTPPQRPLHDPRCNRRNDRLRSPLHPRHGIHLRRMDRLPSTRRTLHRTRLPNPRHLLPSRRFPLRPLIRHSNDTFPPNHRRRILHLNRRSRIRQSYPKCSPTLRTVCIASPSVFRGGQ